MSSAVLSSTRYQARLQCCDRCPSAARFEVLLPTGQNLLLCGPHGYEADRDGHKLTSNYVVLPIPTSGERRVFKT